jgi:nucleoside-diphosphate-sugar epimerase
MKQNILVIGKNSFLAKHFVAASRLRDQIISVRHTLIDELPLDGIDCVVNFSYSPQYFHSPYKSEIDTDRRITDQVVDKDIHYIMFSSRMIYASGSGLPMGEEFPAVGQGPYGKNKIISEKYVTERLENNHTILRLANIFGFEPGRHTFMGHALKTLRDKNEIVLDISSSAFRDFLPVKNFVQALDGILILKPVGVFNLGSGIKETVGDIAAWVIEGFAEGTLIVEPTKEENSFVLNIEKLKSFLGAFCTHEDIKSSCINLGQRLKYE